VLDGAVLGHCGRLALAITMEKPIESEGTVEAKILELHASKRDLAGDILAGLEGSEGLELDELMSLLEA
jgi:hypothetical protein